MRLIACSARELLGECIYILRSNLGALAQVIGFIQNAHLFTMTLEGMARIQQINLNAIAIYMRKYYTLGGSNTANEPLISSRFIVLTVPL